MKIPTELKESRALFLRTYQRVEPSVNTGIVNFWGRVLSESEKNTVEINLLRWFVTAAIPWDAKIFNMLCLSFKVPHRKLLSGKSLEDEYDLVKGYIDPKL
jgi:hypothetical protein